MNKLFIGLLIVAIGTGAFFLLNKKDKPFAGIEVKKELILGDWKADNDSNQIMYRCRFEKDGNVFRSMNDSTKADTLNYEWRRNNELVWKEKQGETTITRDFVVIKLNVDSLVLRAKDSSVISFTKLR